MELVDWNVEEVWKFRCVVEKWKWLRGYKMVEEILLGVVDI